MSLTELKSCLEELQSFLKARKLPLQAADVCGEWEPENGGEGSPAGHDLANHELLEVLKGFDYEKVCSRNRRENYLQDGMFCRFTGMR